MSGVNDPSLGLNALLWLARLASSALDDDDDDVGGSGV